MWNAFRQWWARLLPRLLPDRGPAVRFAPAMPTGRRPEALPEAEPAQLEGVEHDAARILLVENLAQHWARSQEKLRPYFGRIPPRPTPAESAFRDRERELGKLELAEELARALGVHEEVGTRVYELRTGKRLP
jgi:hypothetical protein